MKSLLIILMLVLALAIVAEATPPQELTAEYDAKNKMLTAAFNHTSNKLDKHFIRRVEIWADGKEKLAEYYTRQPAPHNFSYTYDIEFPARTVVIVKAFCSLGGNKEVEMVVPAEENLEVDPVSVVVPSSLTVSQEEPRRPGY